MDKIDLIQRIENYLAAGGLSNPELMDHERVRDLIIDCRDALAHPNPAAQHWHDLYKAKCQDLHDRQAMLGAEIAALEEELEELKEEQIEPAFKLSDAGVDTNITRGLEPKGSGMVVLNQPIAIHVCNLWINPETFFYEVDRGTHPINEVIPVYTAPPKREWVGLTDADLMKEFGYTDELLRDTAYRVQQKLKELNK